MYRPYTPGLPPEGVVPLGAQALHAIEPFPTQLTQLLRPCRLPHGSDLRPQLASVRIVVQMIGSPSNPSTGASVDRQRLNGLGYPFVMGLDTHLALTTVPRAVPRKSTSGVRKLTLDLCRLRLCLSD